MGSWARSAQSSAFNRLAFGTTAGLIANNLMNRYGGYQRRSQNLIASRRSTARGSRIRKGGVRTVFKKRYTSGKGILGGTNADQRLVYRKKRMPKNKRRRWVRFIKKVNAVDERELGSRVILYNDQIVQNNTTNQTQNCLTMCLYPSANNTLLWLNDLTQISGLENTGNPTAAAGGTVDQSTKIIFTSAVMDLTFRNSSTFQTTDVASRALDGRAAVELDVYEFVLRKDVSDKNANYTSLSAVLDSYGVQRIGGAGSQIIIGDRGASPFEFGNSIGRFGVKILKKTKYFVPNNQTITHQIRDPTRHVTTLGKLTDHEGWNYPGWTKGLFFIYKLVPGLNLGVTAGTFQQEGTVGLTRTYKYKIEGFNEDRERWFGSTYTPGPQA